MHSTLDTRNNTQGAMHLLKKVFPQSIKEQKKNKLPLIRFSLNMGEY